jgi:hypothetical protein
VTREFDLLKIDIDMIAIVIRMRGAHAPGTHADEAGDGETARDDT